MLMLVDIQRQKQRKFITFSSTLELYEILNKGRLRLLRMTASLIKKDNNSIIKGMFSYSQIGARNVDSI